MEEANPLILPKKPWTRDGYLSGRAEFLAQERAKALAWAAFQIDRGQPAPQWHWRLGCGLILATRREGGAWHVFVFRPPAPRHENIAAEVWVDDRTGRCDVKFNPEFVWTDTDAPNLDLPEEFPLPPPE